MGRGSGTEALEGRAAAARGRVFLAACALLFLASAGVTAHWCGSMAGGMPMPGGGTMSMAWMRMPGQTWLVAAASFMGMWVVMMVAMMMPSLAPMLWSYRRSVRGAGEARLGRLTAVAGAGYFLVWTALGAAAYPLGVSLGTAEMRWPVVARSVPIATGVIVLLAGCLQLTAWKARRLWDCRDAPCCRRSLPPDAGTAWRHGLHLGVHCAKCCSGLMVILLVAGVMDLGVMAIVTAAITVERLVRRPELAARATGVVAIVAGILAIACALGAA